MASTEVVSYVCPFGRIELSVQDGKLARVRLCRRDEPGAHEGRPSAAACCFTQALDRYFGGHALIVELAALDLSEAGSFARRVFEELGRVPFGEVVSYGELARRVGVPRGARAVGQAVGSNPLPLFIPCHRVVCSDGRLGGFGAGRTWKAKLLVHEGWTVREDRLVRARARKEQPRVCIYAGSFDPPTRGHMYMIEKGAELFDRLIVAVGVNPKKRYTFTPAERLEMLRECCADLANVEVDSFEGQFLVHYAHSKGAGYVLRGVRTEEDYRFEHAMRNINEDLEPDITTVFLIPPRQICEVSSSFVKGLVGFQGWEEVVRPYVPPPVYERLLQRRIHWPEQSAGAEGAAD